MRDVSTRASSGDAEEQRHQRVTVERRTPQVHVHDRVAFCHVELVHLTTRASTSRAPNRSRFASVTYATRAG